MNHETDANIIKRPQVLLLGNGINRAFYGESWVDFIDKIRTRTDVNADELRKNNVPITLQSILVTNNNIKKAIKEKKENFDFQIKDNKYIGMIQSLLSIGFDDILTTNYGYELENVALDTGNLSDYKLRKMSKCTHGRVEPKYLLHTYNQVDFKDSSNKIWHIHGECRKTSTMILGFYWYANQLAKMKKESDNNQDSYYKRQLEGKEQIYNSWIDSFILGDVYILGFGFDYSEIDLWWLLNRRYDEKADKGKVYFYDIEDNNYIKTELLKLFDVEPIDLNMEKVCSEDPKTNEKYKAFYSAAIKDIATKINYKKEKFA